jgi:hypothetical protein
MDDCGSCSGRTMVEGAVGVGAARQSLLISVGIGQRVMECSEAVRSVFYAIRDEVKLTRSGKERKSPGVDAVVDQ